MSVFIFELWSKKKEVHFATFYSKNELSHQTKKMINRLSHVPNYVLKLPTYTKGIVFYLNYLLKVR